MINQTTNYDLFKKHSGNRKIEETNVKALIKSIEQKNLLEFRPILVNAKMEILDGQHRLEAAKRLEVPIYYEQSANLTASDIPLLNIQRAWSAQDCCNHYAAEGVEQYVFLKSFIDKHKIHFSTALQILIGRTQMNIVEFKKGQFKMPNRVDLSEIEELMHKVNKAINFILEKSGSPTKFNYLKSTRFYMAAMSFLQIKAVDFDIFMDKLSMRLDLVRNCPSSLTYINMFKTIYNYKNRNPITTYEEKELDVNQEI